MNSMKESVHVLGGPGPGRAPNEMVERKGVGHPDSVCDALAENLSVALSRFYVGRFGRILHHNVDKALLVGGAARAAFGGGELVEPIEITLAGRATRRFRGIAVPVEEIAIESSRAWLGRHLRKLDPDRDVRIVARIRETSAALDANFAHSASGVPHANDTSFGVGFAPLDRLERAVLDVDAALRAARNDHPEIGDDTKVLGVRNGERLQFTVGCAIVGRHVRDLADYFAKKARIASIARAAAGDAAEVNVNSADGETADSVYLTVTGLSAEAGDDGQVGRGNRADGLITPYRPMSLEAIAGKNPVSHTGKLYNLIAPRIAARIVDERDGVVEAYCQLLSRIGSPITEPALADIGLRLADGLSLDRERAAVSAIVRRELDAAPRLWRDLV